MADCMSRTGAGTTLTVIHSDKQLTRTTRWTTSAGKESSRIPKVKIIATKKEPVTNTTLILKTETVDGTRKTDVVDFMIQTHSTSTYPTIPEGNGMELRNTEINISVKPQTPTTSGTLERASVIAKGRQVREGTTTGFIRQRNTAWRTTYPLLSGPVTATTVLTLPCYPSRTTFLSTPLPQFPRTAEHPPHDRSLLSTRRLQLHGTLPHLAPQNLLAATLCDKRCQRS